MTSSPTSKPRTCTPYLKAQMRGVVRDGKTWPLQHSSKYFLIPFTAFFNAGPFIFRLFDQNYDGYIDKKEFKWMTTSAKVSNKTIDIVFSVSRGQIVAA